MIVLAKDVRVVAKNFGTFQSGDPYAELTLSDGESRSLTVQCEPEYAKSLESFEPMDVLIDVYSVGFKRSAWIVKQG